MSSDSNPTYLSVPARAARLPFFFVSVLLLVEFLDEILDGAGGAAWPLIRDDLGLTYTQVGILLSVPTFVSALIEPVLGILADVWRRRVLVLAGGVAFTLAVLAMGLSYSFAGLLAALVLFNPASGGFVNFSQAALMDAAPGRREQNMVRWTLAGTLGNVAGPLLVGAAVAYGVGWRAVFVGLAGFSLVVLALAWRLPFPTPAADEEESGAASFRAGAREALRALRRREVLRWLALLQFGDLTADVMRGYMALYFVDVVRASEPQAALAMLVWTCLCLPGEAMLIYILERVSGLRYLCWSTSGVLVLFPLFLLAEGFAAKLVLLGALGFVNAGWYSILKAQLYKQMPGRSGTVMALDNVAAIVASLFPLALGAFAQRYGLGAMMWLLIVGPVALLTGLLTAPADERELR